MACNIAIIGMAARLPGAKNLDELLTIFSEGKDLVTGISEKMLKERSLPLDGDYHLAGYIDDIDKFDNNYFNISMAEAQAMDPSHRLLLEVVHETFENAGYIPSDINKNKISVYVSEIESDYFKHAEVFSSTLITGNKPTFLPTRISRHFGLIGNAMLVDTACSSGAVAIHMACNDLRLNQSEYAIVCGANLYFFPIAGQIGLGFDSPDGKSKAFDERANGMSKGEAVAAILLKPLDKALQDDDNIQAVILGSSVNNNADKSASPTAPDGITQIRVLKDAWEDANINPINIGYIEAHGSGTQLGDTLEVEGLTKAFKYYTDKTQICPISTIKNNTGHGYNSAGLLGLIRAVLALKNKVIFPIANFKNANSLINFRNSAVYVNTVLRKWNANEGIDRIAGVTSIGASGTNCHIVLKEAPVLHPSKSIEDGISVQNLFTISAKTKKSLKSNLEALKNKLEVYNYSSRDISFTLNRGRQQYKYRTAFLANSTEQIIDEIKSCLDNLDNQKLDQKDRIIFILSDFKHALDPQVFDYYNSIYPVFKTHYSECSNHVKVKNNNFYSFTFQYCLYKLLLELGVTMNDVLYEEIGLLVQSVISKQITLSEGIEKALKHKKERILNIETRVKKLIEKETTSTNVFFVQLGPESEISSSLTEQNSNSKNYKVFSFSNSKNQEEDFYRLIKGLYLSGTNVKWNSFYNERNKGHIIELPGYQFEKIRCWLREKPAEKRSSLTEFSKITQNESLLKEGGNEIENKLARIWSSVLNLNLFSLEDNFFELGGDSINATKVINEIKKIYRLQLDFEDIFDFPTIASLSQFLNEQLKVEDKVMLIWQEVLKTQDIKPDDNFFELGGHSLLANQILVRIQDVFNLKLNFENIFKYQTVSALSEFIKEQEVQINSQPDHISKATEKEYFELSSSQKRIWILSQFEGGSAAYNEHSVSKIKDNIDINVFSKALNSLIKRHESLHTNFVTINDEPKQKIFDPESNVFQPILIDLSIKDYQDTYINELIINEISTPFTLSEGYLFRVTIIKLKDWESLVCFTIHHIITDGWSSKVFVNDLLTLYTSCIRGEPTPLHPLTIQYKDYSEWQNNLIKSGSLDSQKEYWHQRLSGEIPVLNLPYDKKRPSIQTYNGSYENFILHNDIVIGINNLVQSENSSLFMVFQALVKILLFKYTGQQDIIIGTPIAGRTRKELENQIGIYINTLALRDTIKNDFKTTDFLNITKDTFKQAFNNQDYPFDRLVSELDIRVDMSRSPLFDVMVMFENNELGNEKRNNDIVSGYETNRRTSKFDLTFSFSGNRNDLWGKIEYNTDLFHQATIERMIGHFSVLIRQVIENPEKQIKDIEILTENEKHQLLIEWNETTIDYPKNKCVHQLFEEQAVKTPDDTCLIFEGAKLTYRELNEKANIVAHYLKDKCNTKPGDLIGVLLNRSEKMIISILGILKASCAYIPIDTEYPEERINYILEDSKLKAVISNEEQGIYLDINKILTVEKRKTNPVSIYDSCLPIYIIYTSGSTGNPKGALINHRSFVNYISWAKAYYFKGEVRGNFGLFTSISFDLTTTSIFLPLLNGKKLEIFNQEAEISEILSNIFQSKSIDCVKLTPTHISILSNLEIKGCQTKLVIVGGEELLNNHVKTLKTLNRDIVIVNEYGPTEATVGCIAKEIEKHNEKILIGKPISNTQIYLLSNSKLVPVGVPGEIHISGDGVAQGYYKRLQLSEEKFINNPFSSDPKSRLYKTGDLARYLPDGDIEFLGRTDNQVKIRGNRIELGEIENTILKHVKIKSVAVIVKTTNKGENELVAYYVSENELNITEMRMFLSKTLPNYMIPSYFIYMDAIPISPNGKINKDLLPEPGTKGNLIVTGYLAPRNETEEKLAFLWKEVLGIEKVGINDNFFEIGGHSLKIISLANKTNKLFNTNYSLSLFYIHPSISSFTENVLMVENLAEEKHINLAEEAVLPEDIQVNSPYQPDNIPPKKIFLTGATGFIGQFLLYELLSSTNAIIYCLTRSKNKKEGLARTTGVLKKNNLYNSSFSSRIVSVIGDITKPNMDISENEYHELCREMDVVFHNAVIMNHHADYYTLKQGNVSAIIEVLRFAMKYKTKPIHYSSSTGIFSSSMFNNQPITESSDFDNEKHLVSSGYLGSKWVAEKLIQIAKGRGFPISIYRLGLIIGDTKEGRYNQKQWFALLLQSCIQLNKKFYGFSNKIALTTVDFAVQAIVRLAFKNKYLNGIYHINTSEMTLDEILQLYSNEEIELVPIKEWMLAAKRHLDSGGELAIKDMFADWLNKDLAELDEEPPLDFEIHNLFDASVTLDILAKEGMHFPEINEELINKYFQNIKNEMILSEKNELM